MINRSDAHPSLLRSCLYKQTAIYYFIDEGTDGTDENYIPPSYAGAIMNSVP